MSVWNKLFYHLLHCMWFVYIVICNDDTLYTGIAKDVEKRVFDHNTSNIWAKYTKSRRPVSLVWYKKVVDRQTAAKLEYTIKKMWREKKEHLITWK